MRRGIGRVMPEGRSPRFPNTSHRQIAGSTEAIKDDTTVRERIIICCDGGGLIAKYESSSVI
jgi:hypothetical protein